MTRLTWLLAVTGLASARGYDPEACLNSFTEVASNAIARRTVIITSLFLTSSPRPENENSIFFRAKNAQIREILERIT